MSVQMYNLLSKFFLNIYESSDCAFFICAQNLWSNCLLQQTVLFESGVVYILILNIINFTYSFFWSIHFVVIAISEHSRSELMKNGVSKTLRKGSFTLQKSRNDSSPLFFVLLLHFLLGLQSK
jgi:hypothetical protein